MYRDRNFRLCAYSRKKTIEDTSFELCLTKIFGQRGGMHRARGSAFKCLMAALLQTGWLASALNYCRLALRKKSVRTI